MNCKSCDAELTSTDIALSKKLFGRKIDSFFCIDCIAEYLEKSKDELLALIERFKEQGCSLFG